MHRGLLTAALSVALLGLAGCSASPAPSTTSAAAPVRSVPASTASSRTPTGGVPGFDHIVIVVEENHGIAAAERMQYLGELRRSGRTFTDSHGIAHPSQPNYLALWSGSAHGVTDDACPQDLGSAPSLGSQLLAAGRTVAAYSQGLPEAGSTVCRTGAYARKHNPVADFAATAGAAHNLPFSAFPTDYSALPSVALVVPDLDNDAHDGSLSRADSWLRSNLGGYAAWAPAHNSLLIVTFDEDEQTSANHILTVFAGAHVTPGTSSERIDHVRVLHTVEAAFGLDPLGASAAPITGVWQ